MKQSIDDDKLKVLYPDYTNREIAKMTGWNYTEILNRGKNLGLRKDRATKSRGAGKLQLTAEQTQFLKDNYALMTNAELARAIGLKLTKTREFLYAMGLKRMELEYWTDEQIQFLRDNYQTIGDTELAEIYNQRWPKRKGWTKRHIAKKRLYLKLKRTRKELAAIREDWRQKGIYREAVRKTWEVRGVRPEGEVVFWRINDRLVPHIKVEGRFVHWARYRWQELYGEVPKGMNVCFIDNNPGNMSDDNLCLRTDAELALINSASIKLTDNYIAGMLTHGNPELRAAIKSSPGLIAAKRAQLLLQRELNNQTK